MTQLTTDMVWQEIEKNLFAVLGMVTRTDQARTAGVVYVARKRTLYIGSETDTWKVKHVRANPHVSLTVAIPKRVPLMPWIPVPAATITFQGTAQVRTPDQTPPEILDALFRGMKNIDELKEQMAIIAVEPTGHFVTYGVGVSLLEMRDPAKAKGRVAVA